AFSWSTIVLIVSLSRRFSPWTWSLLFVLRMRWATALVTSATLRTRTLRLAAVRLTTSVWSFHAPPAPVPYGWPPSLTSVPTSRFTSELNAFSWSTIVLIVSASRLYSPLRGLPSIVEAIRWERSPRATASRTRLTSSIGPVRSKTSWLTASSLRAHEPHGPIETRWLIRPSRPTARLMRRSSWAVRWFSSTMSL